MQIGFIGLGAMGGGMASNLLEKNFSLIGYDVYQPSVARLLPKGLIPSNSPQEVAEKADFLIIMVVNASQVDTLLFNEQVVQSLRPSKTILLCSTVPPDYIRDLEARINKLRPDIKLIDSPVSGGTIRAANGTLSIFSSGEDVVLREASTILNAMADPLYHIPGGIGMGSIAKMCHQHHAAVNIITTSGAMALATAAGLNTKKVFEAVCDSSGYSWMFANRVPHMFEDNYKDVVHSATSVITKDAKIVTNYAKTVNAPVLLAGMAEQLYTKAINDGMTQEDDAGLVRLFLSKNTEGTVKLLADSETVVGKAEVTIESIVDLLTGVHVASAYECLSYASKVGLEYELLADIIKKGAGNTAVFKSTKENLEQVFQLRRLPQAEQIREKLVSTEGSKTALKTTTN
jgi:3-hydroxyisobutyrate dehydrogenase